MELFGIVLSIPLAFVASVVYCLFLAKIIIRADLLRRFLWAASVGLLLLFAVEIVLLTTIGAVRSRANIGPAFYVAHLAVFFLGTPAVANVLILRNPRATFRWYWAVPVCTVFAFALVLLQYGVSEALYGVDGTDGPFSERQTPAPGVQITDRGARAVRSNRPLQPTSGALTSFELASSVQTEL
jgi:hypothetical protein